MAGCLYCRLTSVEEALQPMDDESESLRSTTPLTHMNILSGTTMCETGTDSHLRCCHDVQKQAVVEFKGRQPARPSAATHGGGRQGNPGRTVNNSDSCTNVRLRAHTCSRGPRRQTRLVHSKACKYLQNLQVDGSLQLPHACCTGRQSGHDSACAWRES